MIIIMEAHAPQEAVEAVVSYFVATGSDVHRSSGQTRTILGVVGAVGPNDAAVVGEMDGVANVVRVTEPYKLASSRFRDRPSVVEGEWGAIGGPRPWIAVEPVGVEALAGDEAPPSLPYAVAAGGPFDAAVSRSAEGPESLGALACLTLHPQPITPRWPVTFVTRESGWGKDAWLEAAERELSRGADHVVLLEAGSANPDGARTLEVTSLPRIRSATHLPVVVDVPRIAGRRQVVAAVAAAAVAAGASGVILRAWAGSPGKASRFPATLPWEEAADLAARLRAIGEAVRS